MSVCVLLLLLLLFLQSLTFIFYLLEIIVLFGVVVDDGCVC